MSILEMLLLAFAATSSVMTIGQFFACIWAKSNTQTEVTVIISDYINSFLKVYLFCLCFIMGYQLYAR